MINQRNPLWRFAGVRQTAWLFFLFLYLPIVVLVALSFNAGQSATLWAGFSLKWFAVVANDPEILRAAQNSLLVAVLATLIATCLATLAALGMHGRVFRGQTVMSGVLGLPLLMPGILSGAMMAFIISMDDFVITYFVAGAGSTTLPIYIFSSIRMGISPKINAISSIMLVISILFVALSYYLGQRKR